MENQNQIIIPQPVTPIKDIAPVGRTYTKITNATCDCRTIRILKNLLSGRFGELTGIHSYLFQNIISNGINQNLANALNNLSLEELLHANLLGNAILNFGGTPRFSNGQGTFWSGRNVNYQTDQNSFIRSNISREERSIRDYEDAIARVNNESLRQLLREIIEDKRQHIIILNSFLKN